MLFWVCYSKSFIVWVFNLKQLYFGQECVSLLLIFEKVAFDFEECRVNLSEILMCIISW
jgi:hypothetical protein